MDPKESLKFTVPPHSEESEMAVLGSMILSPDAVESALPILQESDFYFGANREIYKAILSLYDRRLEIDTVTVRDELETRGQLEDVGGVAYLIQLTAAPASAANAEDYAKMVAEKSTLRGLQTASQQIGKVIYDEELTTTEKVDKCESMIYEVARKRLGTSFAKLSEISSEVFTSIEKVYESGEPMLGLTTKYKDLDDLTTGFHGGDLMIIAARPGVGKTSLVLNFALNVAEESDKAVAIFSLEMSKTQLMRRLLSSASAVSLENARKHISSEDFQRLMAATDNIYDLEVYIDDNSEITPMQMRGVCRQLAQKTNLGLIIVDYLQLMSSNKKTENRNQEISDIARGLKRLARDLNVPVIALSQLNRALETRGNKRPMLSDLRESGSIEAEADLVMFIYRDEYHKKLARGDHVSSDTEVVELIVAKHRNGPTDTVLLGFQPQFTRFTLLDPASKQQYWESMKRERENRSSATTFA